MGPGTHGSPESLNQPETVIVFNEDVKIGVFETDCGPAFYCTLKGTRKGEPREHNEDTFVVGKRGAAIGDGVGGGPNPFPAAKAVIQQMDAALRSNEINPLLRAHRTSEQYLANHSDLKNSSVCFIGFTFSVLTPAIDVVQSGDGQCLIMNPDGTIREITPKQITTEMDDEGNKVETPANPITGYNKTKPIHYPYAIKVGDVIILGSDAIPLEAIAATVKVRGPERARDAILEFMQKRKNRDDLTFIIITVVRLPNQVD